MNVQTMFVSRVSTYMCKQCLSTVYLHTCANNVCLPCMYMHVQSMFVYRVSTWMCKQCLSPVYLHTCANNVCLPCIYIHVQTMFVYRVSAYMCKQCLSTVYLYTYMCKQCLFTVLKLEQKELSVLFCSIFFIKKFYLLWKKLIIVDIENDFF